MKKLKFLFAAFLLFSLSSCVKFHGTNTSIWADGVWLAPLLPFLGGIYFFIMGYLASKSGSKVNPMYGGGEGGNVPFWQTGWPILGAILWAGAIAALIIQYGER